VSVLAFLGSVLVLTATCAGEPKAESLALRQILDRAVKVYANCKSYRDSGVVKTVFFDTQGTRGSCTVEKPFTTAFLRPDRFRFEYREKSHRGEARYIIWSRGREVQTWWDVTPGLKEPESLDMAIAGATGVSGGSAHTIPALLLPGEMGGHRLTYMTDLKRMEDAKLGDVDCYRLVGDLAGQPQTLWIDKSSFLVRRIDVQRQLTAARMEQTTTYDPVVDGEVSEEMLALNSPRK
jgi:outer membrane lipoprotein-sorting protein